MAKKPETAIVNRITKALDKVGAYWVKAHGSSMGRGGVPDLLVCYRGRFFGMEVKTETNEADPAQVHEMKRIVEIGGGIAGVVRTPAEALALLENTA